MLLARRRDQMVHVLVDGEDERRFSDTRLYANDRGYVSYVCGDKTFRLHRSIVNAPDGKVVDHINGNPLDNRRSNLRICTTAQNLRNSKSRNGGAKGVRWKPRDGKWEAIIKIDYKDYSLGTYHNKTEAVRVYDAVARYYFGEFAWTNRNGIERMKLDQVRSQWHERVNSKRSPYVGVSRDHGRWRAVVEKDGKKVWSQYGDDPKELAQLRDIKAAEVLGNKARLNFPTDAHELGAEQHA